MKASVVLFDIPGYAPFHAIEFGGKYHRLDAMGTGRFFEFRPLVRQRAMAKRSRLADVPAKDRPYFHGYLQGLARGAR